MRMLYPGRPHAFFFDTLEENRYYTVTLDGVDNGDARTGAFTTLKVGIYRLRHFIGMKPSLVKRLLEAMEYFELVLVIVSAC